MAKEKREGLKRVRIGERVVSLVAGIECAMCEAVPALRLFLPKVPAASPAVSLNRPEQLVFDYWQESPDERRFWQDKVRAHAAEAGDDFEAARRLDSELWAYFVERSAVLPRFREVAQSEGNSTGMSGATDRVSTRTSMKNLAELALRLWTEPRAKKRRTQP